MGSFFDKLIPSLRQEFVLVVFLLAGYAVSQAALSTLQIAVIYNFLLLLLIIWLIKVFIKEDYSRQYKGFVILIIGLSLFVAGLYGAIKYYFQITVDPLASVVQYFYLFFPLWIMIEGALMLFILNFDNKIKSFDLAAKINISEPLLGDFIVVALATVVLILLGEFIINFPWYLNISLVLTVNLVIINQFGGEENKTVKASSK